MATRARKPGMSEGGGGHKRQQSSQKFDLSSLRATKMISLKASLPAEIIARILEYLSVPDLLQCARVSRRLQEMVYDDTRWIQRLRIMGVWNEAEARQRVEEQMKRRELAQRAREADERRKAAAHANGSGTQLQSPVSTLFDAGWEEHRQRKQNSDFTSLVNGFGDASLSPTLQRTPAGQPWQDQTDYLEVLSKVRSIRGQARLEFAKVYSALAPYYFDISRSASFADLNVFRAFQKPEDQARMLSQLVRFSNGDTSQGCDDRREQLRTVSDLFEKAALREFEQGFNARDFDGRMKQYANVLVTLNGGNQAVEIYLSRNKVILDRATFGNPSECFKTALSKDINLVPAREFFFKLASVIDAESSTIDRVFPVNIDVLTPLMERVTEQILTPYITPLFDESRSIGLEAYVKAVPGVFGQVHQMVRTIRPTKAARSDLRQYLVSLVGKLFESHIDLYLQDELELYQTTVNSKVREWEKKLKDQQASTESYYMSNVQRQAAKQDFLSTFKKVLMMPVNVLPTRSRDSRNLSELAESSGSRPESPDLKPEGAPPRPLSMRPEAPTTELAAKAAIMNSKLEGISTLISIEVALTFTHTAKASIDRIAQFVALGNEIGNDAKQQCEAIFVLLMEILGNRHMRPGFDTAVEHLSMYRAREATEHDQSGVKPLVTFLELVNVGDLMQQMVDMFYLQELVQKKLSDRDDFLSPAVKEKKRFEQMIDERVAAGLNKGIDVLMDEVEFICATTQPTSDYSASAIDSSSSAVVDVGPTPTAKEIIEIVSSHTGMLVGSTDKNVLDVFNQEVGLRLFNTLCKHIKRQRISVDGAIKLISDLNLYFEFIAKFKNRELIQYYTALRELSQIFLVDGKKGKDIAELIAEGARYKGIFRTEEVYEFAERRADWYQIKSAVDKTLYSSCTVM